MDASKIVKCMELLQWIGAQECLRIETWQESGNGRQVSVWVGLEYDNDKPTAKAPTALAALQQAKRKGTAR